MNCKPAENTRECVVEHRNDGSKLDGEALVAVNLSLKELLLFEAAKTELPVPPRGEARRRIAPVS
jgi:hypothetical protein